MAKMTSIAVPALIAAMAVGPAQAQAAPDMHRHDAGSASPHYAGFGEATNLRREIARLDRSIDRALAAHRISRREAAGLRRGVKRLEGLYAHFTRGGLTRHEARALEARIARVGRSLNFAGRDRDRRRG